MDILYFNIYGELKATSEQKKIKLKSDLTLLALHFNNLNGNFHLICLGVVLLLIVILRFSWLMLGICLLYLGYLLVKSVKYIIMVIIITSFLGVNLIIRNVNYQKIDYGNINLQGVVTSVKEKTKMYSLKYKPNLDKESNYR